MDPFSAFGVGVGTNLVADIVTRAIKATGLIATDRNWQRADELGRLFILLEAAFAEELPAIVHTELERDWRSDDAFAEVCGRLLSGTDPASEHGALVDAIERLVGPTADETARQVAERIALPLPYLMVEAKVDSERVLLELRRVENLLRTQHDETTSRLERIESRAESSKATTLIITSDWPSAAEDALQRGSAKDPDGLAALNQALEGKDPAEALPKLVQHRRPWMTALAPEVWELIAVLCENQGLWSEAREAWLAARDRPGADFAGFTVRAAEASAQAEDRELAVELLDAARKEEPTHPRVAFHDALGKKEPDEVLAALQAIEAPDSAMAALLLIAQASAHLELKDLESARTSLDAARIGGAEATLSYRVAEMNVAVREALTEPRPSAPRVVQLAQRSLELEKELLERRQLAQAAGVRTQAAAFYGLIDEFVAARRVLTEGVDVYNVDQVEPRLVLAMAASYIDHYDVIEALVRPDDLNARALYLRAVLMSRGDAEEKRRAAAELDELLTSEHEAIRSLAAVRRLSIAREAPGIGWSKAAEAMVAARDPTAALALKAFWLENSDRADDAERELLAYSDEAWGLGELMRLTGRAEDWPKAAKYADALLQRDADWSSQMGAAETFRLASDPERARVEFTRLSLNEKAPVAVRAAAYRRLMQSALDAADYAPALQLADGWLDVEPGAADAAWVRVLSLAMLGRDTVAFDALTSLHLHPRQPAEYRLASQLYLSAGDPVEALRKVIAFADEHNPPSEDMEGFVIWAGLRAGDAAIPPELRDRVSIQRFLEMFPESERFEQRSFDDFKQFLEEELPERAQDIQTVQDQVIKAGDMPSAVLAVITGNDMGGLWWRMSLGVGMPTGYGYRELEDAERKDALGALGGPVLWDGTSVFVVDHVLSDVSETIRTAFPNASITQAALADISEGIRKLTLDESSGHQEYGYNLALGKPEWRKWDTATAESYVERARRAREFATKLRAVANSDPADPQPDDEHLAVSESNAFRSCVATLGAARRLKLCIYSDDRDVRRLARTSGLSAFGSIAVIDAMAESKYLTAEQRSDAQQALLRHHALGVNPSGEDLARMAREAGWGMTAELEVALYDGSPWRSATGTTFQKWHQFLRQTHREAPKQFPQWVVHFLQAIHQARPEVPVATHAQHAVTLAFAAVEPDSWSFVHALVRALNKARLYFSVSLGDPAVAGLLSLASILGSEDFKGPPEMAAALLGRAWTMLPMEDVLRTADFFA